MAVSKPRHKAGENRSQWGIAMRTPALEDKLVLSASGVRKAALAGDQRSGDTGQPLSVLIVEDERRLASLLAEHLEELQLKVRVEHHGAAGLAAALTGAFDLIVLDIVLPGLDGFTICRELRRRMVTTPILMLSARGVLEDRVRGLDSGADDYLTKPFEFSELIARVRALLRRRQPAAMLTLAVADLVLDPVARSVLRGSRRIDLTTKEYELLEYLMRNAGQVLTRAMIGEQVWKLTWDRMTNVIDVFINHLRRKIEEAGEPRMIHAVRGVGYVLRPAEDPDDRDS